MQHEPTVSYWKLNYYTKSLSNLVMYFYLWRSVCMSMFSVVFIVVIVLFPIADMFPDCAMLETQ